MKIVFLLVFLLIPNAADAKELVFSANEASNTVSVVDPARKKNLGEKALGNEYGNANGFADYSEVNVHGLAATKDGKRIVVVSQVTNGVHMFDAKTWKLLWSARVGRAPHLPTFTPDNSQLWIPIVGEDEIVIFDSNDGKILKKIKTDFGPSHLLFNNDGTEAYLGFFGSPAFLFIDAKKMTVTKKLTLDRISYAASIALTPDKDQAWAMDPYHSGIFRIDLKTRTYVDFLENLGGPMHTVFTKTDQGSFAYVGGTQNGKITKLKLTAGKPKFLAAVDLPGRPHGMIKSADQRTIMTALEFGDKLLLIDPATLKISATVDLGGSPKGLINVENAPEPNVKELVPPREIAKRMYLWRFMPVNGMDKSFRPVIEAREIGLGVYSLQYNFLGLTMGQEYWVYVEGEDMAFGRMLPQTKTSAAGKFSAYSIVSRMDMEAIKGKRMFVVQGKSKPTEKNALFLGHLEFETKN